jgi:hypothetical protein
MVVCCLDEHATKNGQRSALGQEFHRERDCFAEDIPVHLELHLLTSYIIDVWPLILAQRTDAETIGSLAPHLFFKGLTVLTVVDTVSNPLGRIQMLGTTTV